MEEFCTIKANKCEKADGYFYAKAWLLTGKSFASDGFQIQYELYLLEKRRKCLVETAKHFELLYRKFPGKLQKEITEMINAITSQSTTTDNFLSSVFNIFPKSLQMEVLINEAQKTTLDKTCQIMLLLVKLFPDTVHQHGADLLFSLLACPSEAPRPPGLVTELIPAVLQTKQNWASLTPQMFQILNQCIEHYVLDIDHEDLTGMNDRWSKLFGLVDQIGVLMRWSVSPFFSVYSGANSLDNLYQKLALAFQNRVHHKELSYVTVVLFLHCIVTYHELRSGRGKSKLSDDYSSKLVLVEVFAPSQSRISVPDPNLPVLLTASHCSNVRINQTHLISYFVTATKIWQLINNVKGERVEKDFFILLHAMKSLKIENWDIFSSFLVDYEIYLGRQYSLDSHVVRHTLKLASSYCAINNFKSAAEYVIKAVNESVQENKRYTATTNNPSNGEEANKNGDVSLNNNLGSHREDVSFFKDSSVYSLDSKGNYICQRRVHFLSDHPAEIIAYAANILIKCFHELVEVTQEDLCLGHLLTVLQLEWPSPPAEQVFVQILDMIKRKGNFRYHYFGDFILEPDFLEHFMFLANQQEGKNLVLDIWPTSNGTAVGSSRRIATRGVDKGAKTVFLNSMKKQMFKNYEANLEKIIVKFLTQNTIDILSCFKPSK